MSAPRVDRPIKEVVLITSGDLRQSANQVCWPAQEELERKLTQCFAHEGIAVKRALPVDARTGHGFISSQRMGMDVFSEIDPDAPLVTGAVKLSAPYVLLTSDTIAEVLWKRLA